LDNEGVKTRKVEKKVRWDGFAWGMARVFQATNLAFAACVPRLADKEIGYGFQLSWV
jgi:hypothetical protein